MIPDGLPWQVLLPLFGAALLWLILRFRRRPPPFRVERRQLLSPNEQDFLVRLEEAFPEYRVMVQVSMGALMNPAVKGGTPGYLSIRSRFSQKVVDFVLLDGCFEVVALVELDDRTHRVERDAERDAMTAAAGYVTLRYQSREKPRPQQLREDLQRLQAALARR